MKPELDFGKHDNKSKLFDPQNNFFYLTPGNGSPPLRLPTVNNARPVSPTCTVAGMSCDGLFEPEQTTGRVTGNNKSSWTPTLDDWYETVKLNYGYDFTSPKKDLREYPHAGAPDKPMPDTWKKMDAILAYWQSLGVDGFRCDMAHMEPPEFWSWAIARARDRNPQAVFVAEAYDNDPAKVPASDSSETNVMATLLKAGFTAVYDDPTYKALKKIYDGPGWANDIDGARGSDSISDRSLHYAENHDEVRLAAAKQWGGAGMNVGPVVCEVLFGLSSGPVMLYNGQEVGEPAAGAEGFGGDDSRTSIFDYWSMPELIKWVNGHKYDGAALSKEQLELRRRYSHLLHAIDASAFRAGSFIPLNAFNRDNPSYGRLAGETVSGHWLYCFARRDSSSHNTFVVAANLHPKQRMQDVKINLPESLRTIVPSIRAQGDSVNLPNNLDPTRSKASARLSHGVITIAALPPLTANFFRLESAD